MAQTADSSDDPLAISFGRRLTAVREEQGLSSVELGDRAGMKKAYVWRVEQGKTLPSLRTAARFAKALVMSLSELLDGVEFPEG